MKTVELPVGTDVDLWLTEVYRNQRLYHWHDVDVLLDNLGHSDLELVEVVREFDILDLPCSMFLQIQRL